MKTLTVFTPTYNRAFCLGQLYDSLCRQTSKDFMWLIIDDGSKDNTKELVDSWINENKIDIQYHYKENGGMHTGHNSAYSLIQTDYNVCIDSDDFMPDNAVEIIGREIVDLSQEFAGIIGLDADMSGKIIGTKFPEGLSTTKLQELHLKHNVTGDKKLVFKTEVIKKYAPYPVFKNEKLVPLGYLYYVVDQDYSLKAINEVLAIVEYQADGSTQNMFRQYKINPRGFAYSRSKRINLSTSFKDIFKNCIHLTSCAIFAKDFRLLFKSKYWLLVLLLIPFGIMLHFYILSKIKN